MVQVVSSTDVTGYNTRIREYLKSDKQVDEGWKVQIGESFAPLYSFQGTQDRRTLLGLPRSWPLERKQSYDIDGMTKARKQTTLCHLLDVCHADALQDELSHTISLLDLEVFTPMVEEHHSNRPAVVVVHNSRPDVDHLLHGQAGSRGDARVRVGRNGDGEVRLNESLTPGGDRGLVGTEAKTKDSRRVEEEDDGHGSLKRRRGTEATIAPL